MKYKLKNLEPESVFRNFERLTGIPRESGNEREVSDFLVEFAEKLGLEVIRENCLNVIIKKPATKGYENAPKLILQGHMDMVCVKEDGSDFDFSKDPLELVIDGDYIRAKDTTLGADNGIAVALAMSVLESKDIDHPPICALFTSEEETGMKGIASLNSDHIDGEILINLDSVEEGSALVSCAGGVESIISLPYSRAACGEGFKAVRIFLKGLMGGHSGIEINKNRGNAIKLLGRILEYLDSNMGIEITEVCGGEKTNVIPSNASATILVEDIIELRKLLVSCNETFAGEFRKSDPDITIEVEELVLPDSIISTDSRKMLINILRLIPNGVQTMSSEMEGLVESSLNVGVLEMKNNSIVIKSGIRSSSESLKDEIRGRLKSLCILTGSRLELVSDYPGWEYEENSHIRDLMKDVYSDMYKNELKIDAIHAGVECGYLKEKLGDIDMISIGPDIYDFHTTSERLGIDSTRRVFAFLCRVLGEIK